MAHYDLDVENYLKLSCGNKKNNEQIFAGLNNASVRNLILDNENYFSTLRYLIMLLKELSKGEDGNLLNNSPFSFYFNGASRYFN